MIMTCDRGFDKEPIEWSLREVKILIVDDHQGTRMVMKKMLKTLGCCDVMEAEDGAVAIDLLEKGGFNLVISDWCMPVMNGMDLIKKMRDTSSLKNIPFLMITAEADKRHIVGDVRAGINNYILKPVTAAVMKKN